MANTVAPEATRTRRYRRNNPGERWWFGLLLVPALFTGVVVWLNGPSMEDKLEESSTAALRTAGFPESNVEANGRALTLRVPTGEDPAGALAVVESVSGVSSVQVVNVARDATEAAACASLTQSLQDGKPLGFKGDSTKISGSVAGELSTIGGWLVQCPSMRVFVAGFTDPSSSDAVKVSQSRAQAVANSLVGAGVAADRVSAQGFGSASPVAAGDSPEAKDANNRVVLEVAVK